VIPIPGARTVEHAVDSVRSAGLTLAAADIAKIDDADFSRA